jgi:hypothetical protein
MIDLDGTAVIVVVSTLLGSKGNQHCVNSMVMFMPFRSFSYQWSPWNSSCEEFESARYGVRATGRRASPVITSSRCAMRRDAGWSPARL